MNISKTTATHESKAIVFAFNVSALSQYVHRSISLHSQYIGLGFFSYAILCVCVMCMLYAHWIGIKTHVDSYRWQKGIVRQIAVLFYLHLWTLNRWIADIWVSQIVHYTVLFLFVAFGFFSFLSTLCQFCWPLDFEIWASKSTMSISLHVFPSV